MREFLLRNSLSFCFCLGGWIMKNLLFFTINYSLCF
nr:MAG TPA: hypothetical protein [Caudoviricetes sp.]